MNILKPVSLLLAVLFSVTLVDAMTSAGVDMTAVIKGAGEALINRMKN